MRDLEEGYREYFDADGVLHFEQFYSPTADNEINANLAKFDFSSDSSVRTGSSVPMINMNHYDSAFGNGVQPSVPIYPPIELMAAGCFYFLVASNSLMIAVLDVRNGAIVAYVITRVIDLSCLAFTCMVFPTSDTYRSVSVSLNYLVINFVVYDYSLSQTLIYLWIHVFTSVTCSALAIGAYSSLLADMPTRDILPLILPPRPHMFDAVMLVFVAMTHICAAAGIALLSLSTNSVNFQMRALYKTIYLLILNLVLGVAVGVVGYEWSCLMTYLALIVSRGDYDVADGRLIASYLINTLLMFVVYPFIAIQIKYSWRNKYRRFVEYNHFKPNLTPT